LCVFVGTIILHMVGQFHDPAALLPREMEKCNLV